jgi:hypothetical protein
MSRARRIAVWRLRRRKFLGAVLHSAQAVAPECLILLAFPVVWQCGCAAVVCEWRKLAALTLLSRSVLEREVFHNKKEKTRTL